MAKYEASGSISNQQLTPQRKFTDTYFGEMIMKNQRDGESVADNIRADVLTGNSARIRQYRKTGNRYGIFTAKYVYPGSTSYTDSELYPIVSFQDNANLGAGREQPYETLPHDDLQYKSRKKTLKRLGMDFKETSRQIFSWIPALGSMEWNVTYGNQWKKTPSLQSRFATEFLYWEDMQLDINIPAMNTPEWNDYSRVWKSKKKECAKKAADSSYELLDGDQDFCNDYPTEQSYHDSLVSDKLEAGKSVRNITDVHFGLFATAKTLKEANIAALYYTLAPILKHLTMSKNTIEENTNGVSASEAAALLYDPNNPGPGSTDPTAPNYDPTLVDYTKDPTGLNSTVYTGKSFTMSILTGSFSIKYQIGDWSMCRRYGVADVIRYPPGLKNAKYKHTFREIFETGAPGWGAAGSRDSSFADTRAPVNTSGTCLELRVQDRPDASGRARYLEMRLYNPMAEHFVDVIRDGEHGKAGNVKIAGGLKGFYSVYNANDKDTRPYSDVLMFPISVDSVDQVPLFRRERLVRECAIVRVGVIGIEKLKWYQTGVFKIVMIIVSLVIAYFYPPAGMAGIQAALAAAAVMTVLYVASEVIDNPILLAIISIAAIAYGGYSEGLFNINTAMMVEAAAVVVQTKIAMDMIALQEEMAEFRKMVNKKQEEYDKMKEEVGMNEFNAEWMLYIAGLTPHEEPEEFFERTLATELPDIESKLVKTEPTLPSRK